MLGLVLTLFPVVLVDYFAFRSRHYLLNPQFHLLPKIGDTLPIELVIEYALIPVWVFFYVIYRRTSSPRLTHSKGSVRHQKKVSLFLVAMAGLLLSFGQASPLNAIIGAFLIAFGIIVWRQGDLLLLWRSEVYRLYWPALGYLWIADLISARTFFVFSQNCQNFLEIPFYELSAVMICSTLILICETLFLLEVTDGKNANFFREDLVRSNNPLK